MPYYESVFIARQDISSTQVETLTDDFAKVIEDNGGQVTKRESWGLRSLAYRIKKNRKGHYVLFNIDGPSAAIHEMERQMHLNENILRFLTLKVDELEEGPSAIMRGRTSRDERPRHGDRFNRDNGGDKADDKAPRAESEPAKDNGDKETAPKAEGGDE